MINLSIPLKTNTDLESAVYNLTQHIQNAAWKSTPEPKKQIECKTYAYSYEVDELLKQKRRLRKKWQLSRNSLLKQKLNHITKKLKYQIAAEKNESVQKYLSELTPFQTTDYDLWKATRKLKQPQMVNNPIRKADGKRAKSNREKAETYAIYFGKVFKQWDTNSNVTNIIENYLVSPNQLELPIKKFTTKDIRKVIQFQVNPKKNPQASIS